MLKKIPECNLAIYEEEFHDTFVLDACVLCTVV